MHQESLLLFLQSSQPQATAILLLYPQICLFGTFLVTELYMVFCDWLPLINVFKWHLVILQHGVCIFRMANDVKHLFMYLLAICTTQGHENLSLCSFQGIFIVLAFTFQVYDSFELIFVCTVKRSNFILLHVAIQLSKIILSPLNVLHSS